MRSPRAHLLFCGAAGGVSALIWWAGFPGNNPGSAPAFPIAAREDAARMKQQSTPKPLRKLVEESLALPEAERGKALAKAMTRFSRSVSAEDAEWLLALKRGGGPGISDEHWKQFLLRWAGAQPEKVADFLEGHGLLLASADSSPLLEAWGRGNAAAVLDWVAAGDDKRKQWWGTHCHILAASWAAHDLDAALAWLEKGTGDQMEYAIVSALNQYRGIRGLTEWLDARSGQASTVSANARSAAVGAIVQHTLKSGGPEAAARWVEGRTRADEMTTGIYGVRAVFTAAAPDKALSWLDGLASRAGFPRAEAEAAMNQWVATDSGAAGDWLNAHRSSPAFAEYVWAYAMNVATVNPDAARQWAAMLPAQPAERTPPVNGGFPQFHLIGQGYSGSIGGGFATLEQHIEVVASAVGARNQPAPAHGQLPGGSAARPSLMRYNPVLVRESPGAEPTIRMVPRNRFG